MRHLISEICIQRAAQQIFYLKQQILTKNLYRLRTLKKSTEPILCLDISSINSARENPCFLQVHPDHVLDLWNKDMQRNDKISFITSRSCKTPKTRITT